MQEVQSEFLGKGIHDKDWTLWNERYVLTTNAKKDKEIKKLKQI